MKPERPRIHGLDLDAAGRCRHWRSAVDVVAMRMACCGAYWACVDCHDELAGHPVVRRRLDDPSPAAMCGVCGREMSAIEYLGCGDRCPACGHGFNPGCRLHRHLYFDVPPVADVIGGGGGA